MTKVQRHAELVYAECLLLKAIIGIIYSGDFLAFVKEALNMRHVSISLSQEVGFSWSVHDRSAYAIYRMLAKFVEDADSKMGKDGTDESIDQDFRSGVFLGNGLISLILSLIPSKALKVMEVFGFTGGNRLSLLCKIEKWLVRTSTDREYALATLMKAGGWVKGQEEPNITTDEGVRRQICDMSLLFHHLVISNYLPVTGVDVELASAVLKFNLKRYPQGELIGHVFDGMRAEDLILQVYSFFISLDD
jgi:hypothetical protein